MNKAMVKTIILGDNWTPYNMAVLRNQTNCSMCCTVQVHKHTGRITVQNILYVTDAIVTVGDCQATGEFVMKMMGLIPNVKWVITTSNLVDSATGVRVELHGQGDSAITYTGAPYSFPSTPFAPIHYGIGNALWGQISFSIILLKNRFALLFSIHFLKVFSNF